MSLRTVTLTSILLLAACGSKSDKADKADKSDKADKPAPKPKAPITAALFGKVVAPPGVLATVKRGMPSAEAENLLNDANEKSEIEGIHWWMGLPKDGKLEDILVEFPATKKGVVAEAWGAGQDTDRGGHPVTVWFNPETGIRAALDDDGKEATLRFEQYTPLKKLLGEGPAIAALAKPIVGLTKEELGKAYPELADKDGHLWLPATEWEFGSGTPVSPYPLEGAIESVAFSIPYRKGDEASKAEVLAVLEAKWGKVKEKDPLDAKNMIFSAANPRIEVSEDRGALTLRLSEPAPKAKKGR